MGWLYALGRPRFASDVALIRSGSPSVCLMRQRAPTSRSRVHQGGHWLAIGSLPDRPFGQLQHLVRSGSSMLTVGLFPRIVRPTTLHNMISRPLHDTTSRDKQSDRQSGLGRRRRHIAAHGLLRTAYRTVLTAQRRGLSPLPTLPAPRGLLTTLPPGKER